MTHCVFINTAHITHKEATCLHISSSAILVVAETSTISSSKLCTRSIISVAFRTFFCILILIANKAEIEARSKPIHEVHVRDESRCLIPIRLDAMNE